MSQHPRFTECDLAIIGAGAAGLMAAVQAGRAARERGVAVRIVAFDGAAKLGAKILVAGGGRCNVTHYEVDESAYAGSSRNAIRNVLRRFDVPQTVEFFRELGVELKREETGKLFPVTDSARTVLNALLGAAEDAGVELRTASRVVGVRRQDDGFELEVVEGVKTTGETPVPRTLVRARRVILATGGMALPKSGSDGAGYGFARALGHTVTARVFPALVPLTLPTDHFSRTLAGVTLPATLELRTGTGRRVISFTNSLLFTHFGVSGPVVLDISRYYLDELARDPETTLVANWLPETTTESIDSELQSLGKRTPLRFLSERLPERLARCICESAGVDGASPASTLRREERKALARAVTAMPLPITGHRGFKDAEVTAGGVPLSEVRLETMESRLTPGLHLAGEILDVDGRIGGFNFQWAWATGFIAGRAATSQSPSSPAASPDQRR